MCFHETLSFLVKDLQYKYQNCNVMSKLSTDLSAPVVGIEPTTISLLAPLAFARTRDYLLSTLRRYRRSRGSGYIVSEPSPTLHKQTSELGCGLPFAKQPNSVKARRLSVFPRRRRGSLFLKRKGQFSQFFRSGFRRMAAKKSQGAALPLSYTGICRIV